MTQRLTYIEDVDISYADMEKEGFSQTFINDYQAIKRTFEPIFDVIANPNNEITANRSRLYIDTNLKRIWFNESGAGARTNWIQYV
jgi:hypothetical protein